MVWILATIILLLPSYLIRFSVLGVPTTLLEILIYLGVAGLLIMQPISESFVRLKATPRIYWLAIGCVVIGTLIGIAVASDMRAALGLAKGYIIDPLLVFLLIIAGAPPKQLRLLLASLITSGVVVALTLFFGPIGSDGRALGLYALDQTASPNFAALYLAPITSLAWAVALLSPLKARMRQILIIASLIILLGLIESGSRGAIVATGFAYGLTSYFYLVRRQAASRKMVTALAIVALVVASIGALILNRPDFSETASGRAKTSNNLRYEIWRTTIVDILPDHPITGVGLGHYQEIFQMQTSQRINFPEFITPWARTPHNMFLTLWVEIGLIGLFGFCLLLIYLIRQFPKATTDYLPLYMALFALLIHGLVDAQYWKNDLAVLFWLIVGLTIVGLNHDSEAIDVER